MAAAIFPGRGDMRSTFEGTLPPATGQDAGILALALASVDDQRLARDPIGSAAEQAAWRPLMEAMFTTAPVAACLTI